MPALIKLPYETAARTGFTHVRQIKVTDGELDATGETMDVMPIPVGATVHKVALYIKTLWDKTTTVSVGVAATGASATTFLNAQTIGTGGTAGTTLASAATTLTVNNTASRFITATVTVTSGPATAGEAWLWIQMTDHALLNTSPSTA